MKGKLNPDLFWDESYWQALCEERHSERTTKGE
jgi:hypothetical protein